MKAVEDQFFQVQTENAVVRAKTCKLIVYEEKKKWLVHRYTTRPRSGLAERFKLQVSDRFSVSEEVVSKDSMSRATALKHFVTLRP